MRYIVLNGTKIDGKRAAAIGQENLLRIVGVPVGDALDHLGAVVDDIQRHPAEIGRRRIRGDRGVDRVPARRVIDLRLLLRSDAGGEVLKRYELVASVVALGDEVSE